MDSYPGGRARRGTSRPLLLLPLLLAVSACAALPIEPSSPFDGPRGSSTVRIEVTNDSYSDATLHAYRGGERVRLGTVIGKTESTFTIEWATSADMALEIDFLASFKCITPRVTVHPGDVLELNLREARSADQLRFDCTSVSL